MPKHKKISEKLEGSLKGITLKHSDSQKLRAPHYHEEEDSAKNQQFITVVTKKKKMLTRNIEAHDD